MPEAWRTVLTLAGMVTLVVCGCAASTPTEHLTPDYVPAEVQLGSASPVVSESQLDSMNRYLSTVFVTTTFLVPKQGTKVKTCSGVLIHPSVVLTAGHCVCDVRRPFPPEASDTTLTDASTCAKTASVTLLRYDSSAPNLPADNIGPYTGAVHAHEDLRIIYREIETSTGRELNTEHSNADLAVIVLEEALRGQVRPIKLAKEPIRLEERVILVGYGSDVLGKAMSTPARRYGENKVVSIKVDGSTFHIGTHLEVAPSYSGEMPRIVRRGGSYAAAGDSGGPCFRERKGALELVGIARSTHGPPVVLSVYTSTLAYLDWLREKIADAEGRHTD